MAQQLVNLGLAPNDGLGDPLRTAFDKLNDNDTELYADVATLTGDVTTLIGDVATLTALEAGSFHSAAADPTVNDDSGDGYAVGTRWLNTTTRATFIAIDVTVGAAVWMKLSAIQTPYGYVAGKLIQPFRASALVAGSAPIANRMHCAPFIVNERVTVDAVGYRIATASSGVGNIKFAIYASDTNGERCTGLPIAETANIASNAAAGSYVTAFTASVVLVPGRLYWMAYWTDTVAATATAVVATGYASGTDFSYLRANASMTALMATSTALAGAISYSSAFGAWPDLTGVGVTGASEAGSRMAFFTLRIV
jgi:hypothetical protein